MPSKAVYVICKPKRLFSVPTVLVIKYIIAMDFIEYFVKKFIKGYLFWIKAVIIENCII